MLNEEWLSELGLGKLSASAVAGGDVNEAYKLTNDQGQNYFLLVQPDHPASFYAAEIAGLKLFAQAGINAPQVLDNGQIGGDAYLLLSYLESGTGSQRDLGRLVAKLHQQASPNGKFGFDYPLEWTGVAFNNSWTATWSDLFLNKRMNPLKESLLAEGLWTEDDAASYDQAEKIMAAALANHTSQPVLCHGDLWAGNYMFDAQGEPALIDPAALYGDREFDIGITTVFGGFDQDFYAAYQEVLPLDAGWQQRIEFYRLYLLMVHLKKFGPAYYEPVAASLARIIAGGQENE